MKLSEFKNHLTELTEVNFIQPNGAFVPKHFHITEAGLVTKHFIDCGGTVRKEKNTSLQLWTAQDTEHRLEAEKLLKILSIYEKNFGSEDNEIEVEYQADTIGKYGVEFQDNSFILTTKQTNCLAKDNCGIPTEKKKVALAELTSEKSCCTPGGGCC